MGDRRHFRGNGDSRRSQRNRTNPKRQRRLPRSPAVPAVPSLMLRARMPSTEVQGQRRDDIRSFLTVVCRAVGVFVILLSVFVRSLTQVRRVDGGAGGHAAATERHPPACSLELATGLATRHVTGPLTTNGIHSCLPRTLFYWPSFAACRVGDCGARETLAQRTRFRRASATPARSAGFAWSTLHRVRSRIGAGTRREGFGSGSKSYWYLRDATKHGSIASMDLTPAPSISPRAHTSHRSHGPRM